MPGETRQIFLTKEFQIIRIGSPSPVGEASFPTGPVWTGPSDTLPKKGSVERVKKTFFFNIEKPGKPHSNQVNIVSEKHKQTQSSRNMLLEFKIRYQQTLNVGLRGATHCPKCFVCVYFVSPSNTPSKWAVLLLFYRFEH